MTWRVISFRRALFVIAALVFWIGEGMVFFASGSAVMGWGLGLIVTSHVLFLLNTGPGAALVGFLFACLAAWVGADQGSEFVAWAFTAQVWVLLVPLSGLVLFGRLAFLSIERATTRLLWDGRHG